MILLWWLLACGVTETEAPDDHPLVSPSFRFCHEPGVDAEQARAWCGMVDEIPEEHCPGLRATCEGAEPVASTSGCNEGAAGTGGDADQLADEPEPPVRPIADFDLDFEGIDSVLRWVMAMLVALGVLFLARVLWARFGFSRRDQPAAPELEEVEVGEAEEEALPEVPSAPAADLLTLAEGALAEGRVGEAVVLARGAALRTLGQRGTLRLHRSRTDREYVRQAPAGEVREALREVVAMAEAVRFAERAPDAAAAQTALKAAARLVRVATLVAALIGVGATDALAQSPERYGPHGDAGLAELYRQWGHEVSWRLRGLDDLGDELDVLVVDGASLELTPEAADAVRDWVREGGVAILAGEVEGFEEELGGRTDGAEPLSVVGSASMGGLPVPRFPTLPMVYEDASGEPWVVDGEGRSLVQVQWLGEGVLVGLADSRLLWNGALAAPANEHFVGDLILVGQARAGWPVATPPRVQLATSGAVSSTGDDGSTETNNPFGALASARLLPFVLQLLLWWAVLTLWRGWPFGPRHDPPDDGRLRFADHIDALGERYRRVGDTRAMLAAYGALWLQRLGPSGLQLAARAHGMSPEQASQWVDHLEQVVDHPQGPSDDDDLRRMEELWKMVEHRQ